MNGLALSVESLITECDTITLQTSALLVKGNTQYVDRSLAYMGLESTTNMTQQISTEGVFSWIKEKLSNIGRKFSVAINKIYAKLTRADEQTKELIKRASKDKSIELPISGAKATAVLASGAITVATIIFLVHCARMGNFDKAKYGEYVDKYWDLVDKTYSSSNDAYSAYQNGKIDKKQFLHETRHVHKKMDRLVSKTYAYDRRKKVGFKGIVGDEARRYLSGLKSIFTKLIGALKSFSGAFKSEGTPNNASGSKEKIVSRLRSVSKCISNAFKAFWRWFTSGWKKSVHPKN